MPDNPPDVVNLRECFAMQKACRKELFDHMDANQDAVMKRLGSIEKKLEFNRGREAATASGTGVNPSIGAPGWLKVPSLRDVFRFGIIAGALIAGTFAGCHGAKLASTPPAAKTEPGR